MGRETERSHKAILALTGQCEKLEEERYRLRNENRYLRKRIDEERDQSAPLMKRIENLEQDCDRWEKRCAIETEIKRWLPLRDLLASSPGRGEAAPLALMEDRDRLKTALDAIERRLSEGYAPGMPWSNEEMALGIVREERAKARSYWGDEMTEGLLEERWESEDIKQAACCNENEARIEAALALHEPMMCQGGRYCSTCRVADKGPPNHTLVPWPCPTVKALKRLRAEWDATVKALGVYAHPGIAPSENVADVVNHWEACQTEHHQRNLRIQDLEACLREVEEACDWLLHLAHGVGKRGEKPESGEIEAACEKAEPAVAKARELLGEDDG